jgi:hypothetical protein
MKYVPFLTDLSELFIVRNTGTRYHLTNDTWLYMVSFDKAEPNSQFRGKYIRNLTSIRLSLIFWVVSWKALSASYDSHSGIFFSLQGTTWHRNKVPKIKKILPYEMKFLVPNYSCLQNPCLGGYRPQIPLLSFLCPQLNLLNPPPKKNPGYTTGMTSPE